MPASEPALLSRNVESSLAGEQGAGRNIPFAICGSSESRAGENEGRLCAIRRNLFQLSRQ